HSGGEAGIERRRGASERAGWRGAADIYGLAEIELQAELISRGLRPERVARARHRRGQDQPVDLAFFEPGSVEQCCKQFRPDFPNVAIALLDDLGFRVADDRGVTQSHNAALPVASCPDLLPTGAVDIEHLQRLITTDRGRWKCIPVRAALPQSGG